MAAPARCRQMAGSPVATCTGSSPAMRFAAPSSPGSAASAMSILPMRRASRPRSTRWPPISSATSTSLRSWRSRMRAELLEHDPRVRQPEKQNRDTLQPARNDVDKQRAIDVGGGRPRATVADPGILDDSRGVTAGSREGETERTGDRRLGPAGIRRAVLASVAQHGAQRGAAARLRRQRGRDGDQQSGEPRRNEIERIIKPCRRPAEAAIARREVADHAVERIGGLVDEEAGQAEEDRPEHRRDDAVAEILSQRFDAGTGDAVLVEAHRVAPDDVADRFAPGMEPLVGKRLGDGTDMLEETALRHQHGNDEELDEPADSDRAAQAIEQKSGERGGADQHHDGEDAARAARRLAALLAVEPAIEPGDRPTDEHHRMRQAAKDARRVADAGVEQQRSKENEQRTGRQRRLRMNEQHDDSASLRGAVAVNQLTALRIAKER